MLSRIAMLVTQNCIPPRSASEMVERRIKPMTLSPYRFLVDLCLMPFVSTGHASARPARQLQDGPPKLNFIEQERLQEKAAEAQELYRLCVPIPESLSPEVPTDTALHTVTHPPTPSGSAPDNNVQDALLAALTLTGLAGLWRLASNTIGRPQAES